MAECKHCNKHLRDADWKPCFDGLCVSCRKKRLSSVSGGLTQRGMDRGRRDYDQKYDWDKKELMAMADENVGLRCPKCGYGHEFKYEYMGLITVEIGGEDGKEVDVTASPISSWQKDRACFCVKCDYCACLADFRQKPVAQMLLEVVEIIVHHNHVVAANVRDDLWDKITHAANAAIEAKHERGLNG